MKVMIYKSNPHIKLLLPTCYSEIFNRIEFKLLKLQTRHYSFLKCSTIVSLPKIILYSCHQIDWNGGGNVYK